MQSDNKQIYKLTSERTGEDESKYKQIGNFVFSCLYGKMRNPESLILSLKGIGSWHLRRLRMRAIVELYPPDFEKTEEEFQTEHGFLKNENKKEIYNNFKERLEEYDEYIEIRDKIRKIRYETQTIIKREE